MHEVMEVKHDQMIHYNQTGNEFTKTVAEVKELFNLGAIEIVKTFNNF
jgi:hypothetical protein